MDQKGANFVVGDTWWKGDKEKIGSSEICKWIRKSNDVLNKTEVLSRIEFSFKE